MPSVFISLSLHSAPPPSLSFFFPQLFFCCFRYRARVEKVESPAKVHVFYIDYGNVSNFVAINIIVSVCGAKVLSLQQSADLWSWKTCRYIFLYHKFSFSCSKKSVCSFCWSLYDKQNASLFLWHLFLKPKSLLGQKKFRFDCSLYQVIYVDLTCQSFCEVLVITSFKTVI